MDEGSSTSWKDLNVFNCPRCALKTSDLGLFQAHHCKTKTTVAFYFDSRTGIFMCTSCQVGLSEDDFKEHLAAHNSTTPYLCIYCNLDFQSKSSMIDHLRISHASSKSSYKLKLNRKALEIMQHAKITGREVSIPLIRKIISDTPGSTNRNDAFTSAPDTVPRPPLQQHGPVSCRLMNLNIQNPETSRAESQFMLGQSQNVILVCPTPASQQNRPWQLHSATVRPPPVDASSLSHQRGAALASVTPLFQTQSSAPTSISPLCQTRDPSPASIPPLYQAQGPVSTSIQPIYQAQSPAQTSIPSLYQAQGPAQTSIPSLYQAQGPIPTIVSPLYHARGPSPTSIPPLYRAQSPVLTNVPPLYRTQGPVLTNVPPLYRTQGPVPTNVPPLYRTQGPVPTNVPPLYRVQGPDLTSVPPFCKTQAPAPISVSEPRPPCPKQGSTPVNVLLSQPLSYSLVQSENDAAVYPDQLTHTAEVQNPFAVNIGGNEEMLIKKVILHTQIASSSSSSSSDETTTREMDSSQDHTNNASLDVVPQVTLNISQGPLVKNEDYANVNTDRPFEMSGENPACDSGDFDYLKIIKGYTLCLRCLTKWSADFDLFFKHIWDKHVHESDFSCCPAGYSTDCEKLRAAINTICDRSQEPLSDTIRGYLLSQPAATSGDGENICQQNAVSCEYPRCVTTSTDLADTVSNIHHITPIDTCLPYSGRLAEADATVAISLGQLGNCDHLDVLAEVQPNSAAAVVDSVNDVQPVDTRTYFMERMCSSTALNQEQQGNIDHLNKLPNVGGSELIDSVNSEQLLDSETICGASAAVNQQPLGNEDLSNLLINCGGRMDVDILKEDANRASPANITTLDMSADMQAQIQSLEISTCTGRADNTGSSLAINRYEDISDDDSGRETKKSSYRPPETHYLDAPLDLSQKSLPQDLRLEPQNSGNKENGDLVSSESHSETSSPCLVGARANENIEINANEENHLQFFYKCAFSDCLFQSPKSAELEVHDQQVHNSKFKFPCFYCEVQSSSSKVLMLHMEGHIGNAKRKTFSCSLFENSERVVQFEHNDVKFILRNLETIYASSENATMLHFACNTCQSEFADLVKLEEHLQKSLLKVIECKHCESRFLNIPSWQKHVSIDHVNLSPGHGSSSLMYGVNEKLLCFDQSENKQQDADESTGEHQRHHSGSAKEAAQDMSVANRETSCQTVIAPEIDESRREGQPVLSSREGVIDESVCRIGGELSGDAHDESGVSKLVTCERSSEATVSSQDHGNGMGTSTDNSCIKVLPHADKTVSSNCQSNISANASSLANSYTMNQETSNETSGDLPVSDIESPEHYHCLPDKTNTTILHRKNTESSNIHPPADENLMSSSEHLQNEDPDLTNVNESQVSSLPVTEENVILNTVFVSTAAVYPTKPESDTCEQTELPSTNKQPLANEQNISSPSIHDQHSHADVEKDTENKITSDKDYGRRDNVSQTLGLQLLAQNTAEGEQEDICQANLASSHHINLSGETVVPSGTDNLGQSPNSQTPGIKVSEEAEVDNNESVDNSKLQAGTREVKDKNGTTCNESAGNKHPDTSYDRAKNQETIASVGQNSVLNANRKPNDEPVAERIKEPHRLDKKMKDSHMNSVSRRNIEDFINAAAPEVDTSNREMRNGPSSSASKRKLEISQNAGARNSPESESNMAGKKMKLQNGNKLSNKKQQDREHQKVTTESENVTANSFRDSTPLKRKPEREAEAVPSKKQTSSVPSSGSKLAKEMDPPEDSSSCFRCSACSSFTSYSYTKIKKHIESKHPNDTLVKVHRISPVSTSVPMSSSQTKVNRSGMYKCIHKNCDFTCKRDIDIMKDHVNKKHPYYSCGYCNAPYSILQQLHNHSRFVHRGMEPDIRLGTIGVEQLFTEVDSSGVSSSSGSSCNTKSGTRSAKGSQQSSKCKDDQQSPKSEHSQQSPKYNGSGRSPQCKNGKKSPQNEDGQKSPQSKESQKLPQSKNSEHYSPQSKCSHKPAQNKDIKHSPERTSSHPSNKSEDRQHPPKASENKKSVNEENSTVRRRGGSLDTALAVTRVMPAEQMSRDSPGQVGRKTECQADHVRKQNPEGIFERFLVNKAFMDRHNDKGTDQRISPSTPTVPRSASNTPPSRDETILESSACGSTSCPGNRSALLGKSDTVLEKSQKKSPPRDPEKPPLTKALIAAFTISGRKGDQSSKTQAHSPTGKTKDPSKSEKSPDSPVTGLAKEGSNKNEKPAISASKKYDSSLALSDLFQILQEKKKLTTKANLSRVEEKSPGEAEEPEALTANILNIAGAVTGKNRSLQKPERTNLDITGINYPSSGPKVMTPRSALKTGSESSCGAWTVSHLETKIASEGSQNKDFEPEQMRDSRLKESMTAENRQAKVTEYPGKGDSISANIWQKHKNKMEKPGSPLICTLCARSFRCQKDIEEHYKEYHPGQEVNYHRRSAGTKSPSSDQGLPEKSDRKTTTDLRVSRHSPNNSEKRSEKESLAKNIHSQKDVRSSFKQESRSAVSSRKVVTAATAQVPTPLRYNCNHCHVTLSSEISFRHHLANKHQSFKHTTLTKPGKILLCCDCGTMARNSSELADCMARHGTKRRFKCGLCKQDYHTKEEVLVHMKSFHTSRDVTDVEVIDRCEGQSVVDIRQRLVNIDPKVKLIDPFRMHPSELMKLIVSFGIRKLDLSDVNLYENILSQDCEKYFHVNKFV